MAAPILWAPGIFRFFLLENPRAHKIPPFRGGGFWVFLEGGVEVPILFLWAWGFFRFLILGLDVPNRGAQFAADRTAPIRSDLKPRGRNDQKTSISLEIFNLDRNV